MVGAKWEGCKESKRPRIAQQALIGLLVVGYRKMGSVSGVKVGLGALGAALRQTGT
jgi:hypothetical protein